MEQTAKSKEEDKQGNFEEDEDDAPLSEVIRGLVPKKPKGKSGGAPGHVPGSAGAKDSASTVRNMTPVAMDETLGPKVAEKIGVLKRIRTALPLKGDNAEKTSTIVGKQKVPPDAKLVRGPNRVLGKSNALEEEEIKLARKKAKTEFNGGRGTQLPFAAAAAAVSSEQVLSRSTPRVAAFRLARDAVNKQLAQESSTAFPVSEAAGAEVEFSQEMEVAAAQDYKKVCEDLLPAARENLKDGKQFDADLANRWVETRYKTLQRKVDLHFSVVRHLAGPIFTVSTTLDEEVS